MSEHRSFFQRLADPEEGPLVGALLSNPEDRAAREAYGRWLLAHGDPMGELLLLSARLAGPEPPDGAAALRARFDELRAQADPLLAGLISGRSWVLNCGEAAALDAPVRFAYECDLAWESFTPTANPAVRHCERCQREVYACATAAEAAAHARAGHCISVSPELAQRQQQSLTRHLTGRPHIPSRWAGEIFGGHVENPRPER